MNKTKILIVEDEFIVAKDLQAHVEKLGYRVGSRVNSGEKAIQYIRESGADLVLMDIMLKGKMTGIEAAAEIRSRFYIPVIYVTANTNPHIVDQATLTEPFGFIIKPFNERQLHANIEMALYKHRIEEQLRVSEEKYRSLSEELEQRVNDRTAELQEANRMLDESLNMLQKTQAHCVQSEKMAALGRLMAGFSHEISTPIGIGVTAASYLEQETHAIEQQYHDTTMTKSALQHYLDSAKESAGMLLKNLRRAADQLRSFKQVAVDQGSDRKRTFRLKAYLDDVLFSLRPTLKKTRHRVTVNCPDDLELDSYPGIFSQVVTNFVINSLIHGFEHQEQGDIAIQAAREDDLIRFRYSDNGKGMTEEECSQIFEPFYSTKHGQGGSGLGLYIVYHLVTQRLHGNIACESTAGVGTTFIIQIP
ncbi:MAG: hybrid sensor histidine kinase/response regulator [bacterium]|nr:hybrid sensor histidine kinase/response regulator [bacterium]